MSEGVYPLVLDFLKKKEKKSEMHLTPFDAHSLQESDCFRQGVSKGALPPHHYKKKKKNKMNMHLTTIGTHSFQESKGVVRGCAPFVLEKIKMKMH